MGACRLWAVAVSAWLVGCAAPASSEAGRRLDAALRAQPVVLLGEVHDHAAGHRLRAEALDRWLASGARPALVMEMFDRERQGDLDRALAQPGATADTLIAAAGGGGWNWALYKPLLELALRHRLPIVAANVSRNDARRVMREGLPALGLSADVPPDVEAAHVESMVAGHCGQIDATSARPMARAQAARDQVMATLLEQHAARGAVLIAGDGHVRTDVGVPRWLDAATRARSVAVGLVEGGDAPFDVRIVLPAQERRDPCADMPARSSRP